MMLSVSRSSAQDRPYHHGQLREALLDAAYALLQTHTAAQISLREVARHAGVSHAAPYHHFPDRQTLLSALAQRCNEEFYAAQEQATRAETDPVRKLLALGHAYITFAQQHPNAFTLIYSPEYCPSGGGDRATAAIQEANRELLLNSIQELQTAGYFAGQDIAALSTALWGTVHGLAHLTLLGLLPAKAVPATLQALIRPA